MGIFKKRSNDLDEVYKKLRKKEREKAYKKGLRKGMKPRMKEIEERGRAMAGGMRGYYTDIPKSISPPPQIEMSDSILDVYPYPRGKRKEVDDHFKKLQKFLE